MKRKKHFGIDAAGDQVHIILIIVEQCRPLVQVHLYSIELNTAYVLSALSFSRRIAQLEKFSHCDQSNRMMAPTVLITGGSGYLGQFLVNKFCCDDWNVVYTYNTSNPLPFATINNKPATVTAFKVDFITGEGLDACFAYFERDNDHTNHRLDAVINCVAISQPVACEKDPEKARLINIPIKLSTAMKIYQENQERKAENSKDTPPPPPLLIHLSTDQVYDGTKSYWKETDTANPINQYGKSKLEAEHEIQTQWPHHAILRSSLIYGPEPPVASVGRSLFLQFVDEKLASKESTSFFSDEYRSAVYVQDIIHVCKLLIEASVAFEDASKVYSENGETLKSELFALRDKRTVRGVFNMGGPERLSRVDIAERVAEVRHHDPRFIVPVPSASVSRGVASPSDISMNVSKLENTLSAVVSVLKVEDGGERNSSGDKNGGVDRFQFTKFRDALNEIFNDT